MSSRLEARGLALAYERRTVIEGLDLEIPDGRVTAILGPNASGKSTLLRGLARLQRPVAGAALLDGRPVGSWSPRDFARRVALLPQQPIAPEGITVGELVARGRYPHRSLLRRGGAEDARAIAEALTDAGLEQLATRPLEELSGGQRQRAWIAMTLAQRTGIQLLDEPTTFLDVTHQLEVLELLRRLNRERGTTVVMVLHDLSLAARYADELVVMGAGRIVAQGAPAAVLTREVLREAFALDAVVIDDPVTGTPLAVPRAPAREETKGRLT